MGQVVHGKSGRSRRIALTSSAAMALLLLAGCEGEAQQDARAEKKRAQLPYQLAVGLAEVIPAPKSMAPGPAPARHPRLIASAPPARKPNPSMPEPSMAPAYAFVLDIAPPPPPTETKLSPQFEDAPPALAIVLPSAQATPATAEPASEPALAAMDTGPGPEIAPRTPDEGRAYIPQITDSVRAAYVAQVDVAETDQRLAVRADDTVPGKVQFQVTNNVVSVNIGQVIDLFEGQLDSGLFAKLHGSQAAQSFVSLERLQASGVPLEYNAAYDELILATQRG